jgi:hypothetical protein
MPAPPRAESRRLLPNAARRHVGSVRLVWTRADIAQVAAGAVRRLRRPALVSALTLAALIGGGFALLHLLREPGLSARIAARAVATVEQEQLVRSSEVVGKRLAIGSVCGPALEQTKGSQITFGGGTTLTLPPYRLRGVAPARLHPLEQIEALLAGCPRELDRLIFPRVELRFERHEPIGLRRVVFAGEPAYRLLFERERLRIAVIFNASTLRPVEILVRRGSLSGWSVVRPVVFGSLPRAGGAVAQ